MAKIRQLLTYNLLRTSTHEGKNKSSRFFVGGCHRKKCHPFLPKLQELCGKIKAIYSYWNGEYHGLETPLTIQVCLQP